MMLRSFIKLLFSNLKYLINFFSSLLCWLDCEDLEDLFGLVYIPLLELEN